MGYLCKDRVALPRSIPNLLLGFSRKDPERPECLGNQRPILAARLGLGMGDGAAEAQHPRGSADQARIRRRPCPIARVPMIYARPRQWRASAPSPMPNLRVLVNFPGWQPHGRGTTHAPNTDAAGVASRSRVRRLLAG